MCVAESWCFIKCLKSQCSYYWGGVHWMCMNKETKHFVISCLPCLAWEIYQLDGAETLSRWDFLRVTRKYMSVMEPKVCYCVHKSLPEQVWEILQQKYKWIHGYKFVFKSTNILCMEIKGSAPVISVFNTEHNPEVAWDTSHLVICFCKIQLNYKLLIHYSSYK